MIQRWLDLCRPDGYTYRGLERVIYIDSIYILKAEMDLEYLRIYLSTI
jgi:hypothetical protein